MRKYHRLLIYAVVLGLTTSLFVVLSITSSEKRRHSRRQPHKRTEEVRMLLEEEIQQLLKQVESENNNRLQRIENTCKKYNLGLFKTTEGPKIEHPPVPQYSVFYIDRLHCESIPQLLFQHFFLSTNKFSFCPVYKAGSSTWLYNLCLLAGMTEKEIRESNLQLSSLARTKYPELEPPAAEEALQNTIKIMTVRHPFERLLSAYRDKLENTNYGQEHGTIHFYRKFGRRIVKKYRPGGNNTKVWDILKPSEYVWNPVHPKPAGVEPTFQEFIRYLIDTNLVQYSDDHWIPYYLFCTPCLLQYNVIAKVETMDQDQLYAIRLLGLQDKIKPRWRHKTRFMDGNNTTDISTLAKVYFGQLSTDEVVSLHKKYQIDFDLFGYDYREYLKGLGRWANFRGRSCLIRVDFAQSW